jgi:hypothetical protein
MGCLSDAEVQAVADGEGTPADAEHVAGCPSCGRRVEDRRRVIAAVMALMESEGEMPPGFATGVRQSLARPSRGATALRATPLRERSRTWNRVGWVSAFASAVAAAFVIFVVLPRMGAPTTLSAAEILGRSIETLSSAHGVEQLEYDLVLSGVLNGPHRIEQLIDHDRPNRFRIANYGPDGVLESALSQDPATRQRSQLIRVDGRNYIIRLSAVPDSTLSLPQMVHTQIETTLTMMQATADQSVAVLDTPGGRQYVVQLPQSPAARGPVPFELQQARAVIDAGTFRVDEFEASGTMLRQPFTMSFRLMRSVVQPVVAADAFTITAGPGDVVLQGEASPDPLSDVLVTALRELGRTKGY